MIKLANLNFNLSSKARGNTPTLLKNIFPYLDSRDRYIYMYTWDIYKGFSGSPTQQPNHNGL